MRFRKFRSFQLFDGKEWRDENQVLILDESGRIEGIFPVEDAGDEVEWIKGILMPGMVNCHCHLELSHMKGLIPKNTGMVGFVSGVLTQRQAEEASILEAIQQAEQEMIRNGIVAVGDISNTVHTLLQKSKGLLYYQTFVETTGFLPATASSRFQQSKSVYNYFNAIEGPKHRTSLVPHAPYSVSEDLFQLLKEEGGGHFLSMHSQESLSEDRFFRNGKGDFPELYARLGIDLSFFKSPGKSSLQTVLPRFDSKRPLLLVHNVTTSAEDIDWMRAHESILPPISFCLCPNANLYIGNNLPDLALLRNSGYPLVIGTDSLASNDQLSIWEEIKTLRQHHVYIPLEEFLCWATYNGAKTLGLENELGSFEKGKKPGVLEVNQSVKVLA